MSGTLLPGGVSPRPFRLDFLDGIRGLSALYVLIFHSLTIGVPQGGQDLSWPMDALRAVFGYGHFAVCVFIVLSGFSLMLPLARSGHLGLQRGFWPYMGRRARRVMPPYYAALLLSMAALVVAARWSPDVNRASDEALGTGSVVSHLLLVHNWDFDWAFRINGPMWSVATEWQIYFLFPLLLLPLWRRIGALPTIAVAWAVPLAVHFALPFESSLDWAAPWFVGSFALGMWGAGIACSDGRLLARPWGWGSIAVLAGLVLILWGPGFSWSLAVMDLIVSVMALALILACVRRHEVRAGTSAVGGAERSRPGRRFGLIEFLGSRRMVALGAFSYSLYLLQHPMLRLTETVLGRTSWGFEAVLWVQLLIGTPLILAASRVFAEFFELPFTTGSKVVDALRRRPADSFTGGIVAPTPSLGVGPLAMGATTDRRGPNPG